MPRPDVRIEITGLKEIRARFAAYPEKFGRAVEKTLEAALFILTESVPPYPPPPVDSTYTRTGTLGRTLGSSQTGGPAGLLPEIFEVKQIGEGAWTADWGTRLEYAPYVIGTFTQAGHMGHWWTILTVARRAIPKIDQAFQRMEKVLADWLDGQQGQG